LLSSQKNRERYKQEIIIMPAESEKQRKAACAALSAKRGDMPVSKLKGASLQMYNGMSEKQLAEFCASVKK